MRNEPLLAVTFNVARNDMSLPLKRLANASHVPNGFEQVSEMMSQRNTSSSEPIRIAFEKGTLTQVLDAIVAAESHYTWREWDGVINVLPRENVDPFLDIFISRFEVRRVTPDKAIRELTRTREVKRWMAHGGIQEGNFSGFPIAEGAGRNISLDLSDATVRTVLNRILMAGGGWYWSYFRYGKDDRFLSLTI
jgi:hypothetical protein